MERSAVEDCAQQFRQAAALLPAPLRRAAEQLPVQRQKTTEELRLRAGRPMTISFPGGEEIVPGSRDTPVQYTDLSQVIEIASQASAHTVLDRVRNGYITVRGGHRIGICGSGVIRDGAICNLRQISSLAIRVARSVPGAAAHILDELAENGFLQSTLILSPPGGGKTTLLRDVIRSVSDGDGLCPLRVGIADERGELAAMFDGYPQLDVGCRTDVLDGCPKGAALLMLLRGMNPQVLAADEITDPEDCVALETASNCGVVLLATAHAANLADLQSRAIYRRILDQNIFRRFVVIERRGNTRHCRVITPGGAVC